VKRPLNFVVIATLSIFLTLRIAALLVYGFSWNHVIWAHVYMLGLAIALVWELKGRPDAPRYDDDETSSNGSSSPANARRPSEPPLVSLVMLIAQPAPLSDESLRMSLAQRFGESMNLFTRIDEQTLAVRIHSQRFRILNAQSPYVQDRQTEAMNAATPTLGDAIRQHEAWRSVDLLETSESADRRPTYRTIGALLAELAGDVQPLAVFCPETGKMTAWRGGMVDELRDADKVVELR
jgi:hypothetical protein